MCDYFFKLSRFRIYVYQDCEKAGKHQKYIQYIKYIHNKIFIILHI